MIKLQHSEHGSHVRSSCTWRTCVGDPEQIIIPKHVLTQHFSMYVATSELFCTDTSIFQVKSEHSGLSAEEDEGEGVTKAQ